MRDLARAGFWLPLFRAFGTGLFVSIFAYGVGSALDWPKRLWIAVVVGAAGALLSWWSDWGVFPALVNWLHAPTDAPVEYEPEPEPVNLTLTLNGGRTTQFVSFEPADKFRIFVDGLEKGLSLTNAQWDPMLGRATYTRFRDEFERRGWAQRNRDDPQGGYSLTEMGESAVKQTVAHFRRPPTPTVDYGNYAQE